MSNEPAPPTPPEPVPPPEAAPPPAPLPAFKQGSTQQTGEESKGGNGFYSALGTVALIAVGVGWGLWNAKEEAQQAQPAIAPIKLDMPALNQQPDALKQLQLATRAQTEQARVNIKKSVALSTKATTQEDCEGMRKLLASAENLAQTAAPDLLPEVQQAQRDLDAREPRLPKRADLLKKITPPGSPKEAAPPPREVNR